MLNEVKAKIQTEARARWKHYGRKGLLAIGTGVGKSKIAVDETLELYETHKDALRVLIVVPTEKLRDKNWPDECRQWGLTDDILEQCITFVCYASLHSVTGQNYHLIVLDEAHHLTSANSAGLRNNNYEALMALSATPPAPSEPEKIYLIDKYCPTVFEYSIDAGIEDNVSADYDLYVVTLTLDKVTKNIPAGTKAKPFNTTEAKQYEYLEKRVQTAMMLDPLAHPNKEETIKFALLARARFIYNLPSKTALAKKLLARITSPEKRTLIFAGSIAQAEELCKYTHHSKKKIKKGEVSDFDRFCNLEINELAAVTSLDEGHNIPLLDQALAVQITSNPRGLIQRIGRVVRYREGHKGRIILLVVADTVDEKWARKALASINPRRITWLSSRQFS